MYFLKMTTQNHSRLTIYMRVSTRDFLATILRLPCKNRPRFRVREREFITSFTPCECFWSATNFGCVYVDHLRENFPIRLWFSCWIGNKRTFFRSILGFTFTFFFSMQKYLFTTLFVSFVRLCTRSTLK